MEQLSSSLEDYLETIYNECTKNGYAKVTDISKILNVKKASVTGALNSLTAKRLINYEPYSRITLTKLGEEKAKEIFTKHKTMTGFFTDLLNLSPQEAETNACKIEHVMSEELFKRISKLYEFIKDYSNKNKAFAEELKKIK